MIERFCMIILWAGVLWAGVLVVSWVYRNDNVKITPIVVYEDGSYAGGCLPDAICNQP